MLMSIGFSVVFYNTSSHELGRQLPPPSSFGVNRYADFQGSGPRIDDFFEDRISEGRHQLLLKLIFVNITALLVGGIISYSLARRTLEPIEKNMEAQAQFVSDASHELRTPLTVLQTTNEVALRRKNISTAEAKKLLTFNIQEAEKLRNITDNLLRLAKLENDTLDRTSVPATDIVSDALNMVVGSAVAKDIAIEDSVRKDVQVHADKASLTQALTTVIDNAIKYSPVKSIVRVVVTADNHNAYFVIADEGPGISAENLPHIFERFYRADESRNKQQHEGFGIGLSIAKKIIDKHGGEISVISSESGATFTIKVPLSED